MNSGLVRPALQAARRRLHLSPAAWTRFSRFTVHEYATSAPKRPPVASRASPGPNEKRMARSLPRLERGLKLTPVPLSVFEEAAARVKGDLLTKPVPKLHGIYCAFHQAILQASVSMDGKWEEAFFDAAEITPTDLWEASVLLEAVHPLHMTNQQYLLYLYMRETVAEFMRENYAIDLCLKLLWMDNWTFTSRSFPRVAPRIRDMARDSQRPDLIAVLGFINAREGREAEALLNLQTARRLAAVPGAEPFVTAPDCAVELAKLLVKTGDRAAAKSVIEEAMQYDSPRICYEAALLMGAEEDETRYRTLMVKAAVSGYVRAMEAMSTLESKTYETALRGGKGKEGEKHLIEALEWRNLIRAYQASPEEALRHF